MKAVSTKPRRSMRVATIFTGVAGVAACTLGATQVANAQDVPRTDTGNSAKHTGNHLRPMGHTLSGSIRESTGCGGYHAQWLHVISIAIPESYCYGYRGRYSPSSEIGLLSQCGGNNYGNLIGIGYNIRFGPGTTYRFLDKSHLSVIAISGWTGHDACPSVR